MGEQPIVEIVTVGRELLTGRTLDTNSAWLAAQLTDRGARVGRIVVVDDDPMAVATEIRGARARGARLVVTTGGLGPTFDDRTLAGVAAAVDRRLEEHAGALAFVARRYAELAAAGSVVDGGLTPPRRKMAVLPAGAAPVDNPVGSAPGVLVAVGDFTVLCLPGIPDEMRAVFARASPELAARLPAGRHVVEREVASGSGDESVIAIAVGVVMAEMPGVWLKSLPTRFAPDCDLRVRITASGTDASDASARATHAESRLVEELARLRRS